MRWFDVRQALRYQYVKMLEQSPAQDADSSSPTVNTDQVASGTLQTPAPVLSASRSSIARSNSYAGSSNTRTTVPPTSHTPVANTIYISKYHVLFCTFRGLWLSKLQYADIEVSGRVDDDEFFCKIRQEFRRMRGFWHYWLDPRQFEYCEFMKFTRKYVQRLVKVRPELPLDESYRYTPKPTIDVPPIERHDWYDYYYNKDLTGGLRSAIQMIPKRDHRFQFDTHVSREDMWGLQVVLQIKCIIVIAWFLVITTGGWGFWAWWYHAHRNDWSGSAVPAMAIMTAFTALFLPLNEHMKSHL